MRETLLLKPEEELILLAADIRPEKTILNRLDELIPAISDWKAFTKMAIDRAAAPLIVDKLPKLSNAGQFPDGVLRSLKQASLRTLTRNMVLTEHFRQIIRAFNEAEIPVIALKGSVLSEWLYGNINLRQFSDLDLLVPQEKGLAAVEILRKMGYDSNDFNKSGFFISNFVKEYSGIVHYSPMIKNGVSVEIHIRIHSEMMVYQVDIQSLWQQAVPMQLHGVHALGFCPEDMLLHLCIHLDKHFRSGPFQFTCMYDLVNMLNHKGDVLNWDLFEQKCIQANAGSVTYKYLLLAQKYMNGQLPEAVAKKYTFMLKPKDERNFLGVLRGRSVQNNTDLSGMILSLGHLNTFGKRIHYLFDFLFPTTDFMMKRYRLKRKSQLWLYYPYRQLIASRIVWLTIKKTFS